MAINISRSHGYGTRYESPGALIDKELLKPIAKNNYNANVICPVCGLNRGKANHNKCSKILQKQYGGNHG